MIDVAKICKSFGEKAVLEDAGFSLARGDCAALIGDNGAGKTTLFRIITEELVADSGTINLRSQNLGYVPQELPDDLATVGEFFRMAETWRAAMALERVGLVVDLDASVANLSGGEKTRLMIARVLASDPTPDVLILDEPTNNIDRDGQKWLVEFLREWAGAVIFASHDRHFIDQVANKVFELKDGKISSYGGNYSFYKEQKVVERRTTEVEYEKYQVKKKQLERLISHERQRAKNGLRDKRMKDNDKSLHDWKSEQVQRSAAGQLKARQTQLEKLDVPDRPEKMAQHGYKLSGERSGLVVRTRNVSKNFGPQQVLSDVSFEVHGGERIHVAGANGSGKTTLLKLVLGELTVDSGTIVFGDDIKIGSLSQELQSLREDLPALDQLHSTSYDQTNIYGALRSLELSIEEIRRPLGQLSRGQRTKVALAGLLLGKFNLLVLDEPTNHLEIKTREAIERALADFPGALLFASHDQYFVEALEPNRTIILGSF
jgi:ATPase subunit of ABC transporter with duplicated ATPase domains